MTLHVITVYHNISGRFRTYRSGDTLREVISHCRELPGTVEPEQAAEWLFDLFNADLEFLQVSFAIEVCPSCQRTLSP
jgi:hypothetical protein